MKVIADTHGTVHLRITDDKSQIELVMNYDDQLEHFATSINLPEDSMPDLVKPTLKRFRGESDQVFFDRACVTAYRHFLETVELRILAQSRTEQAEATIERIRLRVGAIEQTLNHADIAGANASEVSVLARIEQELDRQHDNLSGVL